MTALTRTQLAVRGDMLSQRSLRRFAAEALPTITRMRDDIGKVLKYMPADSATSLAAELLRLPAPSVGRCRIKSHAGRPMSTRKGFCVDCAQKQREQDKASWRKRHGTEAT